MLVIGTGKKKKMSFGVSFSTPARVKVYVVRFFLSQQNTDTREEQIADPSIAMDTGHDEDMRPIDYLIRQLPKLENIFKLNEWANIAWDMVEDLRPADYRDAVTDEGKEHLYRIVSVLRNAGQTMSREAHAHFMNGQSDSSTSTTRTTSSNECYSKHMVDRPSQGLDQPRDDVGSDQWPQKDTCGGTETADEERETDARGLYIFNPLDESHVQNFEPEFFSKTQVLPSPPGVDPTKQGASRRNTPQHEFSKIVYTFEPIDTWTFDKQRIGAGAHVGTDHYNKYILRVGFYFSHFTFEIEITKTKKNYPTFSGVDGWRRNSWVRAKTLQGQVI